MKKVMKRSCIFESQELGKKCVQLLLTFKFPLEAAFPFRIQASEKQSYLFSHGFSVLFDLCMHFNKLVDQFGIVKVLIYRLLSNGKHPFVQFH